MTTPSPSVDEFLEHFGRKGMKWGEHRFGRDKSSKSSSSGSTSSDAAQAKSIAEKAKSGGGTKALSNQELQTLVTRMNLEQQYSKLSAGDVKKGKSVVNQYNDHASSLLRAAKITKDVAKFVGPIVVAAAAGAAASQAGGHNGPVKMPRLAIGA